MNVGCIETTEEYVVVISVQFAVECLLFTRTEQLPVVPAE